MEFGTKLKQLIDAKGITQRQLAELVGKEETHISKLINNKMKPSLETVQELAGVLGVSPAVFFENGRIEKELLQVAMSELDEETKQFVMSRPSQPWLKLAHDVSNTGLSPEDVKRVIELWADMLRKSNN